MYTISLADIMQTLQIFRQSGRLQTELPDVRGLKGQFQAELIIAAGKIISCSITNRSGQIIIGNDEAVLLLYNLGELNWTLTLQAETAPTNPPNIQNTASLPRLRPLIPRRIALPRQGQVNTWPRKHRAVFALIDGQKNIEQIAAVLSLSRKNVEEILRDLQSIQVITLE